MSKRGLLFFIEGKWAFGQIHHALIKRLWAKKIYSHLLSWENHYSQLEFDYLKSKFDTFVSTPNGAGYLVDIGIPLDKIVSVAHHEKDVVEGARVLGDEVISQLKGYGVIHSSMVDCSAVAGITRVPKVVTNGVDFDHFYTPISSSLRTVGYGTASCSAMSNGVDFKRGYLAPKVTEGLGLDFTTHEFMYHLCMAGYYRTMDALLVTSSYEGCGLPAMEAAAAGRFVVGSKSGYFTGESGFLCRTPDQEFIQDARSILKSCKEDDKLYKHFCARGQQYARDHYDWQHTIDGWLELFGY